MSLAAAAADEEDTFKDKNRCFGFCSSPQRMEGWMCIIMLAKLGININNLDSAHRIIIMSYTEALMNKLQAIPPSSVQPLSAGCWWYTGVHRSSSTYSCRIEYMVAYDMVLRRMFSWTGWERMGGLLAVYLLYRRRRSDRQMSIKCRRCTLKSRISIV